MEHPLTLLDIASIAHEANRQICRCAGDHTQPRWDDAPPWQTESALAGVHYARLHPEATPRDMHASWVDQKIREGWKWGPRKDVDLKEHPDMVQFEDMAPIHKAKDHLILAITKALLPFADK